MIDWQNSFINIIINSTQKNSILSSYIPKLKEEISIHDAKKDNIVNINSETLKKVQSLINRYSMRDIFKNGKINFEQYKKAIKYDFDSIESELGMQILPNLKKFKNKEDNSINFIIYLYEFLRSNRSSILLEFIMKYSPKELSDEEGKLVNIFIKENISFPNFERNILSSCQIIIYYITKNNLGEIQTVFDAIQKLNKYIEIYEPLKIFFKNNNKFKINSLMSIYNIFEYLCWDQIKNNINEEYKMKIKEKDKIKIKNYIDLNIKEDNLVKKNDISAAIRRLISRYLCGKRGDTDINEYKKLSDYILREDLWRYELQNDKNIDNFKKIIHALFEGIKNETRCEFCDIKKNDETKENICHDINSICNYDLRIGHSLDFYELLNK